MSERARPGFYLGSLGLIFTWHGPLGPMVARYGSWSRERPELVRGLGHPGADRPVTPALEVTSEGVVVVWCEEDGAWASCLAEDGAEDGPRLVLPEAASIALAGGRDGLRLFGGDEGGVVSIALDARGAPRGEPVRHVTETRPPPQLTATRLRDERLCVAVHPGEPDWTSIAVREGEASVVRHRGRRPLEDARAQAVGGRAAVLLAGGGRIEIALLGPGGKVVERPHAVFPVGTGHGAWPDAVWVDDHWVVLARDVTAGALVVQPLGDKGEPFGFPRCEGPFAAAYRSQTFYALEVGLVDDDEAELRLFRCDRRGEGQQQRVDRVPNPEAASLRERRAIRHALGALADHLRRARGYRDAAIRPALGREGASLEMADGDGCMRLTARPDPDGGVALRVESSLGGEGALEPPPSSLVRLAAWVRTRFSSAAREAVAARATWARELAEGLGARLARVERAGTALVLELRLDAMPPAEPLQTWLRRLRDAQRQAP
ncbi:MAG: hypothetical protein R3B82_22230 [Sandaracinaceae bacterium]